MAKINWIKIKNEYVNTNISQRKLAEKHKISFNTLKAKARKECWGEVKKEQYHKTTTKLQQKTAEKIVQAEVNRIEALLKLADEARGQIELGLTQLGKYVDMFGNVSECEVIDVNKLRKLIASLKDLKDIAIVPNEETKTGENAGVVLIPEVNEKQAVAHDFNKNQ